MHAMIRCTMVLIKLKTGYEYVQNMEAGILNIGYRLEMQTLKWTKYVCRFKTKGQKSIKSFKCIIMSEAKQIGTDQCTDTSRNRAKSYHLRMGVKPATF